MLQYVILWYMVQYYGSMVLYRINNANSWMDEVVIICWKTNIISCVVCGVCGVSVSVSPSKSK